LLDRGGGLAQHFAFATKGEKIMATSAPAAGDRSVSIGRVLERAFIAVRTNPGVILGLALVIGAIPGLIMTYLLTQIGVTSSAGAAALANGTISTWTLIAGGLISWLVMMIIAAVVQGALTRATVSASEGRRASFGESLSTGLRVFLPLIGLSIVFSFGVALGFVLLIVPGIILLLMWSVAVPSLVIEREGVFAALSRSGDLTKGARWKILGLFLVLIVLYWLISIVLGLVGLSAYSTGTATMTGLTTTNLLGSVVTGTIFNVVWGTIQPSLYVELRQWKEGTTVEALEQVFA
jgi:hypothetical protein